MSKSFKIWLIIFAFITAGFIFIYNIMIEMEVEDKYGDFIEFYHKASTGNLIIIENKEFGFIQKYDRDIYIEQNECMKHILNYSKNKIEVYEVEINQTYSDMRLEDALALKNKSTSKLIFRN